MQLVAQLCLSRALSNEVFHNAKFRVAPGFKTTGVMKYEAWIALEHHGILDIMTSSLRLCKFAT
jgi:hypothetical protein